MRKQCYFFCADIMITVTMEVSKRGKITKKAEAGKLVRFFFFFCDNAIIIVAMKVSERGKITKTAEAGKQVQK